MKTDDAHTASIRAARAAEELRSARAAEAEAEENLRLAEEARRVGYIDERRRALADARERLRQAEVAAAAARFEDERCRRGREPVALVAGGTYRTWGGQTIRITDLIPRGGAWGEDEAGRLVSYESRAGRFGGETPHPLDIVERID